MDEKRLIYDITEFPYKREITKRFPYPFFGLNKITGGAEVGGLVILFAKTNQGKSEFGLQLMAHWIQNGEKVVAMLGEHSMKKAQSLLYKKVSHYNKDKWQTIPYGKDKDGKDLGIYETFISEEDEQKAIELFKDKLFLYDTRKGFGFNDIIRGFNEGKARGCSIAVLDNQMMIDLESTNELREQTDNTEKLRQYARLNKMLIVLIAHARKVEPGRIRLSEYDIQGSSNVANKGTTIMSLTRTDTLDRASKEFKLYARLLEYNYIDINKCDSILEVVKEKNGVAGFVGLKWYESTKTYREVYDKDMIAKKERDKEIRAQQFKDKDLEDIEQDKPTTFLTDQQLPFSKEEADQTFDDLFGTPDTTLTEFGGKTPFD